MAEFRPQRTFRYKKYIVAYDSLLPSLRGSPGAKEWLTMAEAAVRFPDRVRLETVRRGRNLPAYQLAYTGEDTWYGNGLMPAQTLPDDQLLRIKNGRVFSRDGVIYGPEQTAIREFDYEGTTLNILRGELSGGRWNPRYWKHALRRMWRGQRLPPVRRVPGTLAAVNGDGSHNYCHFMIEILPRLLTLQNSGVKPDWYLIDAYLPFHLQSLQAFGIPREKIIQPHQTIHLEADELVVPARNFPSGCSDVGALLKQNLGIGEVPGSGPRLFVNRRISRRAKNYADFKALLTRFDFAEFHLEDWTLPQQIGLFHRADTIVAMHGAGLSNLMFSQPGARVIELMPEGKRQHCYPNLSRLGGLKHWLISLRPSGLGQDMNVPLEQLEQLFAEFAQQNRRAA